MFEYLFEYLIIGWAAVMGVLAGSAMAKARSRRILRAAQEQAERIQSDAADAAKERLLQGETVAREEALKVRRESTELERSSAEQNELLEARIRRLEARNEEQEAACGLLDQRLQQRRQQIDEQRQQAQQVKQESRQRRREAREQLERRADMTAAQMRDSLVEGLVDETRAECADRLRNLESTEAEELARQAKRIMGIAMARYGRNAPNERLSSNLPLTEQAAARLRPLLDAVEQETGVHLALSDSGESVRLEGGDGTARELTRRVVDAVCRQPSVDDLAALVNDKRAGLDRELLDTGRKAFKMLGLKPAAEEILRLVGRLNYRTSYTQNQWRHCVEASFIAGLMAAELRLDVRLARRASLLHDIGKALTHEVEGSHAVIGAEIARRCGEDEVVANAVGAHHGDEPAGSPYAHLVAASDAMSGARPGARREMVETYVDRINDLERIANNFNGVTQVHAVQAGREIRVQVDERKVDDAAAERLSEQIASRISDELTFPGVIRVTVIRELKAIEMAG